RRGRRPKRTPRLDPAAEGARGRYDDVRRRVELARAVELAFVLAAPDQGVELDARLPQGGELARSRHEDPSQARVVERLGVAADEVDGVEAGELRPRQPAVSAAWPQLFSEDCDRPLSGFVDVREGAAGRFRLGDGPQLDVHPGQLCARAAAELVRAERGGEKTRPREPSELGGRDGAPAGRRLPRPRPAAPRPPPPDPP